MIVLYKKYFEVVCLILFSIIIMTLFPMYDIAIFGENARLFKNIYLYAHKNRTDHQNTKIYIHWFEAKNPPEENGTSFFLIS